MLQVSGLDHPIIIMSLFLFSSCRTEVNARPGDPLRLSDYEGRETSSKIAQAVKETGLKRNQGDTEVKDASNEIAQARKEQDVTRNREGTADGKLIRTRFTRNAKKNRCIKRYDYRIIYNHFFAIPICKKRRGCKEVIKFVNFGRGKTLGITYNCKSVK